MDLTTSTPHQHHHCTVSMFSQRPQHRHTTTFAVISALEPWHLAFEPRWNLIWLKQLAKVMCGWGRALTSWLCGPAYITTSTLGGCQELADVGASACRTFVVEKVKTALRTGTLQVLGAEVHATYNNSLVEMFDAVAEVLWRDLCSFA